MGVFTKGTIGTPDSGVTSAAYEEDMKCYHTRWASLAAVPPIFDATAISMWLFKSFAVPNPTVWHCFYKHSVL